MPGGTYVGGNFKRIKMQKTQLSTPNALHHELNELKHYSNAGEIEQELWQLYGVAASSPMPTKDHFFEDVRLTIQKVSSFLKLAENHLQTQNK